MGKNHVLLDKAVRKPYKEIPEMPAGSVYDTKLGYWKLNGEALVTSSDPAITKLGTKKCDQETGEDQKGE